MKKMQLKKHIRKLAALLTITLAVTGVYSVPAMAGSAKNTPGSTAGSTEKKQDDVEISLEDIPEYDGSAYVTVNDNEPFFEEADYTTDSFEDYSKLDKLGRCGVAYANICQDIMPTEERASIGSVKPSGWHTVKYNDLIDGNYLYNRCHLIGYQLAGENANEKNLITGTRYLNVIGMLPYENLLAEYVEETDNHVLYRVTPMYDGKDLVATGVLLEAWSVEDEGEGICFNVFCYNVQPGIDIDYSDGDSERNNEKITDDMMLSECENKGSYESGNGTSGETTSSTSTQSLTTSENTGTTDQTEYAYVLNTNTKKFHYPTCRSVDDMKEKNKAFSNDSRDDIISSGYSPCGNCHP